ncbi:MAG: hypothetical protein CL610_00460 [Anaerolineaceae bacterium]|nr:hypothetical protein [Anaerolineaceae bacterium]
MVTLRVQIDVTEDREVTIKLPSDFPVGKAEVVIEVESGAEPVGPARQEPLSGAEIVARGLTGGWKNLDIEDSTAWVEAQKRKRRERHQWQQD